MSIARNRRLPPQGNQIRVGIASSFNRDGSYGSHYEDALQSNELSRKIRDHRYRVDVDQGPSFKRRKFSSSSWEGNGRHYLHNQVQQLAVTSNGPSTGGNCDYPSFSRSDTETTRPLSYKSEQAKAEDDVVFMSREEIERCSPSRKDGIDLLRETHLRYSYCAFLQNLGMRLDLPQTTIGTAMVLCHRFFLRRSHASHDRFTIATAALFLAAKSEETARPLNTVLRLSYEICHKQDLACFPYLLPADWFEHYREQILGAEHMILTTLDFELTVQHPYTPLTSVLCKLGLSQSLLVNLAWNLVSEGNFCKDLWRYVCTVQDYIVNIFDTQYSAEATLPLSLRSLFYGMWTKDDLAGASRGSWNWCVFQNRCQNLLGGDCICSWLRSSLWLQFRPHHIAAGAAFLAAKFLNVDLSSYQTLWQEFQTTPAILQDVVQQLMELF